MTARSAAKQEELSRTDPRRLRELMDRVASLAESHEVPSVVVGVAGRDGDPRIPEFMDFVESALRMEDAIFRMTRERSVLFLTDVDRDQAEDVVDRLMVSFTEQTASSEPPSVALGYAAVAAGPDAPLLRDVLLEAFPARS
jgi:hypothetical protein